jgi:hypothetical protein
MDIDRWDIDNRIKTSASGVKMEGRGRRGKKGTEE